MLKDLNHLMSCSQDNYIRENNFLQENLDFVPSFFISSVRSTSYIPILNSQSEARRIQNNQFKDNFS